jgi:predicted HTH transcriptional regulator
MVNINVNKIQRKIVELMIENPCIMTEMLSTETGIVMRNILTNITELRKAGIIDHKGTDKNGDWVLKVSLDRKHHGKHHGKYHGKHQGK